MKQFVSFEGFEKVLRKCVVEMKGSVILQKVKAGRRTLKREAGKESVVSGITIKNETGGEERKQVEKLASKMS